MNVIGDAHGVSKMSVSRSIHSIAKNIAKNIGLYIQFPMTNTERQSVMFNFYDIKEFPLVLGAVDGTSVDEHLYVFRKGFHALNMQGVCDTNNLFTNIVGHYAGSTHDAHIWNNCKLSEAFESRVITNCWLLGRGQWLRFQTLAIDPQYLTLQQQQNENTTKPTNPPLCYRKNI